MLETKELASSYNKWANLILEIRKNFDILLSKAFSCTVAVKRLDTLLSNFVHSHNGFHMTFGCTLFLLRALSPLLRISHTLMLKQGTLVWSRILLWSCVVFAGQMSQSGRLGGPVRYHLELLLEVDLIRGRGIKVKVRKLTSFTRFKICALC